MAARSTRHSIDVWQVEAVWVDDRGSSPHHTIELELAGGSMQVSYPAGVRHIQLGPSGEDLTLPEHFTARFDMEHLPHGVSLEVEVNDGRPATRTMTVYDTRSVVSLWWGPRAELQDAPSRTVDTLQQPISSTTLRKILPGDLEARAIHAALRAREWQQMSDSDLPVPEELHGEWEGLLLTPMRPPPRGGDPRDLAAWAGQVYRQARDSGDRRPMLAVVREAERAGLTYHRSTLERAVRLSRRTWPDEWGVQQ